MEKEVEKNDAFDLAIKTKCFNLQDTLECGQCFRWDRIDDGSLGREYSEYIGVISDRVLHVKQEKNMFYVRSNNKEHLKRVVDYYFDLYNNYDTIEEEICKIDDTVKRAVDNTSGIHILNQAQFETIISYIISANNNIPRIRKSIAEISKRYGTLVEFEGKEYYLFPTIDQLANVTIEEFK